jgi:hypothetical protein
LLIKIWIVESANAKIQLKKNLKFRQISRQFMQKIFIFLVPLFGVTLAYFLPYFSHSTSSQPTLFGLPH